MPGREEKVELNLPPGVELTRVADKSLSEMLASGEIDCAIIARPPTCFLEGHRDVVRLYPNYLEMEEDYFERTKVWPIMHIIAIQKHILDENPWVARNLYNAFQESKRRSLERLLDPAVSRYPLAWLPTYARAHARHVRRRSFPLRHRGKPRRPGSRCCSIPISKASRIATPRSKRFSRRGS